MADINLTIQLKDLNAALSTERFLKVHPHPMIPDPKWVDPEDGSEAPQVQKYATNKEWVQAYLANHLYQQVRRGKQMIDREADAIADTDVQEDFVIVKK